MSGLDFRKAKRPRNPLTLADEQSRTRHDAAARWFKAKGLTPTGQKRWRRRRKQ